MKMKAIMCLMSAATLLLASGCNQEKSDTLGATPCGNGLMVTVSHDGHLFTVWDGAYAGCILHSPSCPCGKK